jgi:hypothetical protein
MKASSWLTPLAFIAGLVLTGESAWSMHQLHPEDETGKGNYLDFSGLEPGPPGPPPPASPNAGRTRLRTVGHANPGGFNADVVAHEGFAYLASWGNIGAATTRVPNPHCPSQGVRVFDLDDPSNPRRVATFADGVSEPDVAGTWTEKVVVRRVETNWFEGNLAIVTFQNCGRIADPANQTASIPDPATFRGFGVYDVTDPTRPTRLALYAAPGTRGSHEIWLEVRRDRAYVYTAIIESELTTSPDGTTPGRADFRIVDVSLPRTPTDVGEWGAWKRLGIRPRFTDAKGVARRSFVHSVIGAVAGDKKLAYLSYWDTGTVILDVSDPANPTFVGRTATDEEGNAHSAWLARGGRILIQADEDFDPAPNPALETSWGYARIVDISGSANPWQLGTFELPSTRQFPPPGPGFFTVHDPKVQGDLVFLSYYAEGVVVIDVSRPAQPSLVTQFVPTPAPDPFGFFFPTKSFANVWGVFLHEGLVLASDINSGLWVLKMQGDDTRENHQRRRRDNH